MMPLLTFLEKCVCHIANFEQSNPIGVLTRARLLTPLGTQTCAS